MHEDMRNNGSVTGREIELRDGQVIISRSDRHGRIVDVNPEFVEVRDRKSVV